MAYLDQFLQAIVAKDASDLHIGEGQPPKMRRHGDVMAMRPEPVLRDEAVLMLSEIAGPRTGKFSKNAVISISPTRWTKRRGFAAIS